MTMPSMSVKRKRGNLERTFNEDSSEVSESGTSDTSFKISDSGEDTDSSTDGLNFKVDVAASKGISGRKKVACENSRSSSTVEVKKGKTRLKEREIEKKKQCTKGKSIADGHIQQRRQKYSKQVIDQAIKRIKEGASKKTISEELGVSVNAISRWRLNCISENESKELQELRKQRLSRSYNNETVQEVCKLMREGAKTGFLAKQYKVPIGTIIHWRHKFVPESLPSAIQYSDDIKIKVIRRLKNGESVESVAAEMKIAKGKIVASKKRFLNKMLVTTAEGSWEYDGLTKLDACNRLKHGAKLEIVAKELDVHISVLRKWKCENVLTLTSQKIQDEGQYDKKFILSVCESLQQGESAYSLSRKLGITKARVNVWRQKYCSSEAPTSADTQKFGKNTIHQACELLKSGMKPIDVSRKLQVSTYTLLKWRRTYLKETGKTPYYPKNSFSTVLNLAKDWQYCTRMNILEIHRLLNQGDSIGTVAEKLNLNFTRVQALRSQFIVKGKCIKDTSDYAEDIVQQVHERFSQGTLMRSISKEFHISLETVNYWYCKYLEELCAKFLKKMNDDQNWKDVKLESLPIVVLKKDPKLDQLCRSRNFIPSNKRVDIATLNQVCNRVREGASMTSVAKEFGTTRGRVSSWCKWYFPKEERILRKSRLFSNDEVIRACRLVKQGASISSVAKRYGVNKRTISDWQSKVNIFGTPNLVLKHNACDLDTVLQGCRYLKNGDSASKVAKRMGVALHTAIKWRWRYLMTKVRETTPRGKWEYNRYTRLAAYHQINQGVAAETIAKELGIDVTLVRMWEKKGAKTWLQLMDKMKRDREMRLQMRNRLRRGEKVSKVSKDLGIPHKTVELYKRICLKTSRKETKKQRGRDKKRSVNSKSAGAVGKLKKQTTGAFVPLRKIYIPNKMKLKFVEMIDDGVSIEKISRELNLNKLTVQAWILNRDLLMKSCAAKKRRSL